MKEFNFIKEYYTPIQPAIKVDNKEIIYREVKATNEVENFVYCFWQLKTPKELNQPFIYRVVSDGCIDIFFEQNRPTESFVMGFCRKYTEFPIGKAFNYIGIRFLPSAFPLLFNINANKISNQSHELKGILPDFSKWISSKINPNQTFEKIVFQLDKKLSISIQNQRFYLDSRFFSSLYLIFKHKGFLDIEKDLKTGLSPRQLRRIFNYHIGTTPKAFSNVVRFQYILNSKPSLQSLKENKLYFDVGFFDQAHFIKNFKTFYGVTPSEAFR